MQRPNAESRGGAKWIATAGAARVQANRVWGTYETPQGHAPHEEARGRGRRRSKTHKYYRAASTAAPQWRRFAAALYGSELADISPQLVSRLEIAVWYSLLGPSTCSSKEIVFTLLVPSHRVASLMVVPYKRICRQARLARTHITPKTLAQVVWEATPNPKPTGPQGDTQG